MRTELEPVKWADGTYRLFLPLKQLLELERNCGATDRDGILRTKSVYAIHEECGQGLGFNSETGEPAYLGAGNAHAGDIREAMRLLLIGGDAGMVNGAEIAVGPLKANQLCEDYCYPARPLVEAQYLVWSALDAAIRGVQLKKKPPQSDSLEAGAPGSPEEPS